MENMQNEKFATGKKGNAKKCNTKKKNMKKVQHEKVQHEKAQHEKSAAWKYEKWKVKIVETEPAPCKQLRWTAQKKQLMVTLLEIVQHERSATQKKLQHAKSATGEESKTKTLERGKVQHDIESNT